MAPKQEKMANLMCFKLKATTGVKIYDKAKQNISCF
jgi:hypothetical protein